MNYLIVCKSDNRHFLLMHENGGVQAYTDREAVMKAFGGYTSAWTRSYTDSMSACIGMMQMQPIAIEAPQDPLELEKYITEMTLYNVHGGAVGRGYRGLPVSEEIFQFKQFEIWQETMKEAKIM